MDNTCRKIALAALGAWVMMGLSSCEKTVLMDEEYSKEAGETGTLRVSTRGVDDDTESQVSYGRIYVFDNTGKCVELLATDEENPTVTTPLAAGNYTLCAVGGDDLDRFSLPTQSAATPTSAVSLKSGKVMSDLLIASKPVTIVAKNDQDVNIELQRKVLCIDEVTIKDVPTNVDAVEVIVSGFKSRVCLDGSFPESPIIEFRSTLTKTDATTWKSAPNQYFFPSAGNPTIHILFTTGNQTKQYSYTSANAFEANQHFKIEGEYNRSYANLTLTLTAENWGETQTVNFEFDDTNQSVPVAGEKFRGHFVVSVDTDNRQAVLLSKQSLSYEAPASGSAVSAWKQAVVAPMASLEKPTGSIGDWRLPTLEEASYFAQSPVVVNYIDNTHSPAYFCMNGDVFSWVWADKTDSGFDIKSNSSGFNSTVKLRPVITIEY